MWKRSTSLLAATVTVTVVAASLAPTPAQAARVRFTPLAVQAEHVVAGKAGRPLAYAADPAAAHALSAPPPAPVWPAAGMSTVDIAGTSGIGSGRIPVRVRGAGLAAAAAQVRVDLLDRASAPKPLANAVLVRLTRTDADASVLSQVDFDYTAFRTAFGGDWAVAIQVSSYWRWVAALGASTARLLFGEQRWLWSDNARDCYCLTAAT